MDGFPSGQRGQTVNLLQIASMVRIHLRPYAAVAELADARDLKSNGWIVKLWQIFLEKSRILKFHI